MPENPHHHFKIHKPLGMLSQLNSNEVRQIKSKRFLSELYDFPKGTMPVGRLDEKSEGLLLLTTNGKLSDNVNRMGVEKEYYAQLDGVITKDAINRLRDGVEIGLAGKKYSTKSCKAERLEITPSLSPPDPSLRIGRHRLNSWITITLTEGRFRQVRKMTAAVGFPTLRLVRVRIGNIYLDDLDPGSVYPLADLVF
ncbi:MAG: pseudouridine synthase [Maribacter sp.]|nr:pseudouridine synthase [Maribacter sp.]